MDHGLEKERCGFCGCWERGGGEVAGKGGTPGGLPPAEGASDPAAPGTPGSWCPRSSPSVGSRSHPPQETQSCPCQTGLTAFLSVPLPPDLQLLETALGPNYLICKETAGQHSDWCSNEVVSRDDDSHVS